MSRISITISFVILSILMVGCATNDKEKSYLELNPKEYISIPYEQGAIQKKSCFKKNQRRNIAIFLDGTDNNESSNTNISRLSNLAIMQPLVDGCPRNYVLYVKGVGTEGSAAEKLVGKVTGAGFDKDIRQAYHYLSTYYRGEQDQIYIFGFSRGAAAARALNTFLYLAGIPNNLSEKEDADEFINQLYSAYKNEKTIPDKKSDIRKMIGPSNQINAPVRFLGVFDTVAALGLNHLGENKSQLNSHYSESICNVHRVAQALSIDDNRATDFTPALFHKGLLDTSCADREKDFTNFVDQVWFSGAHADIGGGYIDTDLSGVALNWMIERVQFTDSIDECQPQSTKALPFFTGNPSIYADPLGLSHDAEKHLKTSENRNRDWPNFMNDKKGNEKYVDTGHIAPVLHKSVFKRLKEKPRACRECNWLASDPKYTVNYPGCFYDKLSKLTKRELKEMDSCTNSPPVTLTLKEKMPTDIVCPTEWVSKPSSCN